MLVIIWNVRIHHGGHAPKQQVHCNLVKCLILAYEATQTIQITQTSNGTSIL